MSHLAAIVGTRAFPTVWSMSGRFIVNVIAVIGWLIAAVFAYAFLTLFGFAGVGFYGLLLLFICMQVELEPDEVSHHRRLLGIGFFKILGIGLTVIGFGGFLCFQLD
jgi:hypothetical protein